MSSTSEIMQRISDKYGSLDRPTFHWAQAEFDRDPHAALRAALRARFQVTDVTDLNSDVSFAYDLVSNADGRTWTVRFSMVGPYATVIRHAPRSLDQTLVDGVFDAQSADEVFILSQCERAGLDVLSRDLLGTPVALRLFDTSPGRARVYQALFSDVDFLPGEYSNPSG